MPERTKMTASDPEEAVRNRYAQGAVSVEKGLCCPAGFDPKLLAAIPQDVPERDYGCGDPSRYLRPGETVLDLGSGAAKVCFIASQVVGWVLSEHVTPMNHQEGFIANPLNAALLGPVAMLVFPMSTTHVSSGAIIGVGIPKRAGVNWSMVRRMILAWIVTVPLAAVLGVLSYAGLQLLFAS